HRAVVEVLGAGPRPVRWLNARVRAAAGAPAAGVPGIGRDASGELEAALAECGHFVTPDGFLRLAAARGYVVDEPFHGIRQLWHNGDGVAVARIGVPDAGYPAVLETGLQPLLTVLPAGVFLLSSFESVTLYGVPEGELWSVVRCAPQGGSRGVRADVLQLDAQGRLLAEFRGVRLDGPVGSAPAAEPGAARESVSVQDVVRYAAEVLGIPAGQLDPRRSLLDFGLDSLMATTLVRQLRADFGLEVPLERLMGNEAFAALAGEVVGSPQSEVGL
ncbi:phosphopantetheine-binding protein, partial [Streptomyces sp. UNOC14_S4]|uniref:phosphopantetheine-binding protein n=1 Tax=Streptomyces sp. UNOC14_S4 TaxID=2872340 RepID=UPI001E2A36A0